VSDIVNHRFYPVYNFVSEWFLDQSANCYSSGNDESSHKKSRKVTSTIKMTGPDPAKINELRYVGKYRYVGTYFKTVGTVSDKFIKSRGVKRHIM